MRDLQVQWLVAGFVLAVGANPDQKLEPDRFVEPFSARGLLNVARAKLKEPSSEGDEGNVDAGYELRPQPGYEREKWLSWVEACLEALDGA